MSDFGQLRSYDRFLIPVHVLVWTASISWRVAIFSQLQLRRTRYHDTWRYLRLAGKGGGATCYLRGSQPSSSLCCSWRWHFQKSALSTDKFKLKIISRSWLYIYTLYVSCIVLVYYFVPFIVSNRYLLFWVSNGHNSVPVQNRTHVYMNFLITKT